MSHYQSEASPQEKGAIGDQISATKQARSPEEMRTARILSKNPKILEVGQGVDARSQGWMDSPEGEDRHDYDEQ